MQHVTRLAPSPTGALHLGNARTFLANWAHARKHGWTVQLRIDDIDGPRVKSGAMEQAIDDLKWLGMDWDGDIQIQSHRLHRHRKVIEELIKTSKVYPCTCSRKEIELAASAPHAEDGSAIYPGTCKGKYQSIEQAETASQKPAALRLSASSENFTFTDSFAGEKHYNLKSEIGDFVIAKPEKFPAYQLACVVDDHDFAITDVIRADDLLDSVPRQVMIYRALGWEKSIPDYYHLPLVVGEDGKRLAKRHGDTRIAMYRENGVSPDRLRALIAKWLGIDSGDTISISELVETFDFKKVAHEQIVYTQRDDQWLKKK